MKKVIFFTFLLVPFLFFASACGSSSKEKQNRTQVAAAGSSDPAPAAKSETVSATPVAANGRGEKLFEDNGCMVCHQLNTKVVGPPLTEIAKAYKDNKKGLDEFLKGNAKSIIDPAQHAIMEPQIKITKEMSEEDRMAIVDYLLSVK